MIARYGGGRCEPCGEVIKAGDSIIRDGRGWRHSECNEGKETRDMARYVPGTILTIDKLRLMLNSAVISQHDGEHNEVGFDTEKLLTELQPYLKGRVSA